MNAARQLLIDLKNPAAASLHRHIFVHQRGRLSNYIGGTCAGYAAALHAHFEFQTLNIGRNDLSLVNHINDIVAG